MYTIQQELEQCRAMLAADFKHTNPLLDQSLRMVQSRSGKMMRPALTLLAARLFTPVNTNTLHAAVAYEAFHTASLIHDDVVDESNQRRGQESINHNQGNKVAVLVGDYILSIALHHLSQIGNPRLVDVMSEAAAQLADGELLQLLGTMSNELSEQTYFDIIRAKTAALFAACAASGAITAGAAEEEVKRMYEFGQLVGICFQMKDDIFDYLDNDIGKPTGNDMAEGKLTLPAIYAIRNSKENLDEIVEKLKKQTATTDEIRRMVAYIKESGGIEYTEHLMYEHANRAKLILQHYADSETKDALMQYVDNVTQRKF